MPYGQTSINWYQSSAQASRNYTCGYCGHDVAPNWGYYQEGLLGGKPGLGQRIYVCSFCNRPTYFDGDRQTPGALFGSTLAHLPTDVESLYEEARRCMTVTASTSAVLACRKLLMNTAVEKKAPPGKPFIEYVEYLDQKGYVPPDGKVWVDHIRKKANEATHEIPQMTPADAEELLTFTEMLLRFVYEFPGKIKAKTP